MDICSLRVEKFKRISGLEIGLKEVTLLIGGNNSGKSSFLQGVHFAVTTLQSSLMVGGGIWPVSTLAPDQFIFKPTTDPTLLHNNSGMTQTNGPRFVFSYKTENTNDLSTFDLRVKRGKNANISVVFNSRDPFFTSASDRTRPMSIFVPGLAGVALREERRTDSIVTNGIAQGDSNLYLRNVLLRIIENDQKIAAFHLLIGQIFFGLEISTDFDQSRHQFIDIQVRLDDKILPLEMLGTGCLQAIQLVAYTTMYDPTLLLLDEPDSHLHPSNQRLLATTLASISSSTSTKVIISTHSRHMFDALARNEQCEVIWLKNGEKQPVEDISDLSLLLDLGALDSFERFASPKNRVVVLTEDTRSQKLKKLLEANGFIDGEYFVQSLHGVDNVKSAFPVADFFTKLGSNTHVLIHRDGDALTTEEKKWLIERAASQLPARSSLFITPLTDVEHQFCLPEHIAASVEITLDEAWLFANEAIRNNHARLAVNFATKRQHAKDRTLRQKSDVPSAEDLVKADLPFEWAKGKTILGLIIQSLNAAGFAGNRILQMSTSHLEIQELKTFAAMAWQSQVERNI